MTLQDRVALVTGAGNGIGRGIVERFARDGVKIIAFDLEADALDRLISDLAELGEHVEPFAGDIAQREAVAQAVALAVQRFGALDILAANAGIADGEPFLDIEDRSWQRIIDVNVTGTFYCFQEAARVMAMQQRGAIVATSSTNAFYVETNLAHYNASKGAIEALVRSAAIELAWHGIRVNAVAPSMVRTRAAFITNDSEGGPEYLKRVPMQRFAEPAEVAAAVAFLASDEASYVTGQTLILDGGLTLGIDLPLPSAPMPHSTRTAKD